MTRTENGLVVLAQEQRDRHRDVTTFIGTNHEALREHVSSVNENLGGLEIMVETRTTNIREDIATAGTISGTHHAIVTGTLSTLQSVAEDGLSNIVATRKTQQTLVRQQASSTNRILASVKDGVQQLASLIITVGDDQMTLSGVDLEALALPLALMRNELEPSLKSCLTVTDTALVRKEFEALLALSYEASARAIRNPTRNGSGRCHQTNFSASTDRSKSNECSQDLRTNKTSNGLKSCSFDHSAELVISRHTHRSIFPRSTETSAMTKFQPEPDSEAAKCFQILTMVTENRLSSIWGRGGSLIHDLAYFDVRWDFECLPFADIVDELLADGEEINAGDETGCTPLLNACYLGCSSQFIELLPSRGADLNAVDSGGWSGLHQVLHKASVNCERYGGGKRFQSRDYLTATDAIRTLLAVGLTFF